MSESNVTIQHGQKPTKEQLNEIKKASKLPITFDNDCPELTAEQLQEFAVLAKAQKKARKKQVLALRVSSDTLSKAKTFGKGYTGLLSRILDEAMKDPDFLRKCL